MQALGERAKPKEERVCFTINGEHFSAGCEVCSDTSLLDFIRDVAGLSGTKYMCREAGCGACVVAAVKEPGGREVAVNSCVVPVLKCRGWDISTIESLGNRRDGYHPIQRKFADCSATQCGYCTPGWIMSLYSRLQSEDKPTMLELEQSFGSNICRCTGYRPILDAIKSFASDAPSPNSIADIEDLKICRKDGKICTKTCDDDDWCMVSDEHDIIMIYLKDGKKWYSVKYVSDIFEVLKREGSDNYMLVHGNTGRVPYPMPENPDTMIDISGVEELQTTFLDQNLSIGAGVTITKLIEILESMASKDYFGYLNQMVDHLKLVAHIPVRNLGSLGGNLMIKHQHNEFPSDIYLLCATVGAMLTITSRGGAKQIVSMQNFLRTDMTEKVILNILLPPFGDNELFISYKIMPRSQSTHAKMNAGLYFKLSQSNTVKTCRIVYGNLSPHFNRAESTEKILIGKKLFTNETVQLAVKHLQRTLVAAENPTEGSPDFRKSLAIRLFYKGILALCPKNKVHPRYASGAIDIRATRPVSRATQVYDTNSSVWPLNQPINKVEAEIQCSGEAQYVDDIPKIANEAYVAYVVTTEPTGTITNIDACKALKCDGVLAFFSAKDIPGLNSFTPNDIVPFQAYEEVFCDGTVKYMNQPLGIIVAETQKIATKAAKLVVVTYADVKTPVVDLKDAMKDDSKTTLYYTQKATDEGTDIAKSIKHRDMLHAQYAFTIETLVCVARPTDHSLQVFSTTQWPDGAQRMISKFLKMDTNKIDVILSRLGAGFGFKLSRSLMTACACSLAATKLNIPCRFVQSVQDNTRCMGKRLPVVSEWEIDVDSSGVIQKSSLKMYEDNGCNINEDFFKLAIGSINNCYDNKRWNYECFNVITDTPSNTWLRSPGTYESVTNCEMLFERIAHELSADPLAVRMANLSAKYEELKELIETVKIKSDYDERKQKVRDFNAGNRWKKRGLSICPLRWTPFAFGINEVLISVYHEDGTVAIVHGGVEMGQGINTKAIQVCASMLEIPTDKIQIKPTNTISAPNCYLTGASVTSQNVCYGVKMACEKLLKRLEPIQKQLDKLGGPITWEEKVNKAWQKNISLMAHGSFREEDFKPYEVYAVTVAEVEIDVLTGECGIRRVDLLEDVGQSVNPAIDIGQIEGAFIMGVGCMTSEKIIYSPSGELLTDRPWLYYPLLIRDIPQDFRIYFRKDSISNDAAFGSKCTGEPATCSAVSIPIAIRYAIFAARLDTGLTYLEDNGNRDWFDIEGPYDLESICMATNTKLEHMVLL